MGAGEELTIRKREGQRGRRRSKTNRTGIELRKEREEKRKGLRGDKTSLDSTRPGTPY
jgi:hypothetical protein